MSEEHLGGAERVTVYGWSTYEDEGFTGAFATKEEALADAYEDIGKEADVFIQAGFYEDVTTLAPTGANLAEHIIELIGEESYEHCGEFAEDWPDVPAEAEKELADALDGVVKAWMAKHLKMPAWQPDGEPEKFPAPEPST